MNAHYEYFHTSFFGLDHEFYAGKRILGVGCGPRGSLEWASMTGERVGLDPLASRYSKVGAWRHQMRYVDAPAEDMPLAGDYFDVVCSFNSLDHVARVERTAAETTRVLKPGGLLLLIVEVNHPPTACEPLSLPWNVTDRFPDALELLHARRFEIGDHDIYGQLRKDTRFDKTDTCERAGILAAKMRKRTGR